MKKSAGLLGLTPLALAIILQNTITNNSYADRFTVETEQQLRDAIISVNSKSGSHFIDIKGEISISKALPPILNSVTIRGVDRDELNKNALKNEGIGRLLTIGSSELGPRILVQIQDLGLFGGQAYGGEGQAGGGGGLGAGGAILVNSRADVIVENMYLAQNTAQGGNGSLGSGGGGGGLAGHGGAVAGGGGGGLVGNGGNGIDRAGGGGGFADGGVGDAHTGGGGGLTTGGSKQENTAQQGAWNIAWLKNNTQSGQGSGVNAGGVANQGGGGGAGDSSSLSAGGGGGFAGQSAQNEHGGDGGFLGGGGGAGLNGTGGNGGFGGGGGGSINGQAGNGGFGGGGGGSVNGQAGNGGFGGGGGSSVTANGGDGGFGAGAGNGVQVGQSGIGAGTADQSGGAGGAGLGGAIFVKDGGSLSLGKNIVMQDNHVNAGSDASQQTTAQAAGSGLFLQGSGNLFLRGFKETELTIEDNIADALGAGLTGASEFDRWNVVITGQDKESIIKLTGDNKYSGNTYVQHASVLINDDKNLGASDSIIFMDDGHLAFTQQKLNLEHTMDIGRSGASILVDEGLGASGFPEKQHAILANEITGSGSLLKAGKGDLSLTRNVSFNGQWIVEEGRLLLKQDSHLGAGELVLDGGSIAFEQEFKDLRAIMIEEQGGTIDNNSFNVDVQFKEWDIDRLVIFSGDGTTRVKEAKATLLPQKGNSLITDSHVIGAIAQGKLKVESENGSSSYSLGDKNRTISFLSGNGHVNLGQQTLTLSLFDGASGNDDKFKGQITGLGGVVVKGNGGTDLLASGLSGYLRQRFEQANSYQGGTVVGRGAILQIISDDSVARGSVKLNDGGVLSLMQSASNLNIQIQKLAGIETRNDFVMLLGEITGTGDLVKEGTGTLILNNNNTYTGNTYVSGEDSFVALAHVGGLGEGSLYLKNSGGLRLLVDTPNLRSVILDGGIGVIDTDVFDVYSAGSITGSADDSSLLKMGTGRLQIDGRANYKGETLIKEGILEIGAGGANGSIDGKITIEENARLVINRAGVLELEGIIGGDGGLTKKGTGTLFLKPDGANLFLGGLDVEGGLVAVSQTNDLGLGSVTLKGGGLLLNGDINRDTLVTNAGGSLQVDKQNSYQFAGNVQGEGVLTKQGTGTVVLTGANKLNMQVDEGTLQIGEDKQGTLVGDVKVQQNAKLIFSRNDISQYDGVISGQGEVIKAGLGELVLTGTQNFAGTIQVQQGNLRVGLGGDKGSLSGDVNLSAQTKLIFDRSDNAVFQGSTQGAGLLQKSGTGILDVTGGLQHTGGTFIHSGTLRLVDGADIASVKGQIQLFTGSQVAIARKDNVDIVANLQGQGNLLQQGEGTTRLTGNNQQMGLVILEKGKLAIDQDARLGQADLIMDGGMLRYDAAFNNLRDIRLRAGGGGLDTNGFDIDYQGQLVGKSRFVKDGLGRLTFNNMLSVSQLEVKAGELRIGDGKNGLLTGNAQIFATATLTLNRDDDFSYDNLLTGEGTLQKLGTGILRLSADNSLFAGTTIINAGGLRLDQSLGGNLILNQGSTWQGNGKVLGNVISNGGEIKAGNSIGQLSVNGDLSLDANSVLTVEVDAAQQNDKLTVGGTANLAGTVKIQAVAGNYAPKTNYTLINAQQIQGSFANLVNDLIFLDAKLTYTPTTVELALSRNKVGFETVSLTRNQKSVAMALDQMPENNAVVKAVSVLDVQQALKAYDELHGDSLLAPVVEASSANWQFNQNLATRASRLGLASRGAGQNAEATSKVEGVWFEALQANNDFQDDEQIGSAAHNSTRQGMILGIDGYWGDSLMGIAVGQIQSDVDIDSRQAKSEQEGIFLGWYGRGQIKQNLHWKAALSLSQTTTEHQRYIALSQETAKSTLDNNAITAILEAGWAKHWGDYGFRPFVQTRFQWLDRQAFSEQQATMAGLSIAAETDILSSLGLGIELSKPWLWSEQRWVQLDGRFMVLQALGDGQFSQQVHFANQQTNFTIESTPNKNLSLSISLGAEAYLTKGFSLWGGYNAQISSVENLQNLQLSARYRW